MAVFGSCVVHCTVPVAVSSWISMKRWKMAVGGAAVGLTSKSTANELSGCTTKPRSHVAEKSKVCSMVAPFTRLT